MRIQLKKFYVLAVVSTVVLWACEAANPAQPHEEDWLSLGTVPITVSAPPELVTLAVTISAGDIATPLIFNVTLVDGAAQDTLVIPAGSNRTMTVRGFDAQAIETHRGERVIDVVEGPNSIVTVIIGSLAGQVPLVIGLGELQVQVEFPRDTLSRGTAMQAISVVQDETGDTVPAPVRWATLHPAVALIDSTGLVTSVGEGATEVIATWQGVGGAKLLEVVVPRPAALFIVPDSASFAALGDTTRLQASMLDQFGDTISDAGVQWSSSNENVAIVDAGLVTSVANGSAIISATIESLIATANVVVEQRPTAISVDVSTVALTFLGDTARVGATVEDARGTAIEGLSVTWSTSAPATVTVTGEGLVTALASGTAELTATYDSIAASVPVQVSQIATSVTVTPDTVVLFALGETVSFTATELDAGGSPLPTVSSWVWNSDFDAVASIDASTGVATALSYGTAGITAQGFGGAGIGRATLTVALTGSEVRLDQSDAIALPGDTLTVKATVFDDLGVQLADRNAYVEWTTSNLAIASVSPGCAQARCTAEVVAQGLGAATITASSGTGSATFELTVAEQIPASILVTPEPRTLTALGDSQMFSATVLDQVGAEITGASVTWSSSAPSVAQIDADGLAVAVSNGTTVITAESGSVSAEVSVTVAIGSVNLTVLGVRLNQGNQSAAGDIPGVVGRSGLLRVLVQADEVNSYAPSARVSLYSAGQLLRQEVIPAPQQGVPLQPDLGLLSETWNLVLDPSEAVADLDVVVELDPDGLVPESDEVDNVYAGPIDMQELAPLRLVFFPIEATVHGTVGNISPANAETMLSSTGQWIPTSSITYEFRAPFVTSEDLSTADGWSNLLVALQAARTAEGAVDEYYHGIIGDFANPAWGGLAYRPSSPSSTFRSGLSYDRMPSAPATIAHELGHNLGRPHAPCGNPANIEALFPYPDGTIGQSGYNLETGTLIPASTFDYMSYCSPDWTSDWAFGQIVNWRANDPLAVPSAAPEVSAESRGLLVYGRITASGVVLSPAFSVDVPPNNSTPEPGAHELRGVSNTGAELFRLTFAGTPVEDGADGSEEHFAFVVPLSDVAAGELARLDLTSPAGSASRVGMSGVPPALQIAPSLTLEASGAVRARWDTVQYPAALLRDPRTNRIRGIVQGGDVRVDSRGEGLDAFELVLSDGLRSVTIRGGNE